MKRWLLLALALVALVLVLVEWSGRDAGRPPLDEIDAGSREQLRDVLREPTPAEPVAP
ncbi:MAG TPA: hypothetical protein VHQ66_07930 [Myxococcota bacterium]|nr:hypothetical protein [Myxococcota bacterium]